MSTSELTWLEELFQMTSVITGDVDGVAHVTATTVRAEADVKVTPESQVGHTTTSDAMPVDVVLFTLTGAEQRRVDVVVTATNADGSSGGTWTIRARLKRVAGTSSLITGGTDPAPDATAGLAAVVILTGDGVVLRLTGLGAESTTFGWEARSQRQVI